ncbi:MAG: ABC transporter ATP-binding protein [Spirochaetales bacterium]|nr:ABC transporter ATP-binding protein [Spirochaetales bacterium]
MSIPLIEVKNIKKNYFSGGYSLFMKNPPARAIEKISFKIFPGETVGLAGESGCGKTTIGRIISLLEKPAEGEVFFKGNPLMQMRGNVLKNFRKNVQFIFQDSYFSFNPRKTLFNIIKMGLQNFHLIEDINTLSMNLHHLFEEGGVPKKYLYYYPHELSKEQKLRIAILRAAAVKPELIICDDLVSSSDFTVQAQIINLLQDLKNSLHFSLLFISHDLALLKYISDRILVLYMGRIVETAPSKSLFLNTAHPYTKALISAIPDPAPDASKGRIILKGDVTAAAGEVKGCCFADRCYMAQDICKIETPLGRQLIQGHTSYCHFPERV